MSTPRPRRIASFAAGGSYAQGLPAAAPATGYTPGPNTSAAGSWGAAAETGGIQGDSSVSPVGAPGNWGYGAPAAPAPAALPADAGRVAATPYNIPTSNLGSGWANARDTGAGGAYNIQPGSYAGPVQEGQGIPTSNQQLSAAPGYGSSGRQSGIGGASTGDLAAYGKGGPVKEGIPTEHFAGGGRSGHGGFTTPALPPGYITDIGAPTSTNDQQDPYQRRASAPGHGIDSQHHLSPGDYSKGEATPDNPTQGSGPGDIENQGGNNLDKQSKGGGNQGGQQPKQPGSSGNQQGNSGGWNGGLDNLPASAPADDGAAASGDIGGGIPTDPATAAGAADASGGAAAVEAAAAATGFAEGGPIVNPKEEPYREKWRAKNGQKQTPYKAFDDGGSTGDDVPTDAPSGGIPDSPDIPVQQDQGQQGQAGDPMQVLQGVKAALSYTRQQAGLSDNAFKMATDQKLAGNMPSKPAGPGGDQPNPNPFPIKTPATPFGTKTSQNDSDDEAA